MRQQPAPATAPARGVDGEAVRRARPATATVAVGVEDHGEDPGRTVAWYERSAHHLRQTLEGTGLSFWDWDLSRDHVERRGDYAALLGVAASGLTPKPGALMERVHPVDRPRVSAALQHAISTASPYEHVFRLVRADGSLRRVVARGHVVLGPEGRAEHLVGMMLDLTSELGSADRPTDMFEHSPEPYLSVDRQLRIGYLNAAAERMLGQARDVLLGRDVQSVPGTLGVQVRGRCEQVLRQRRPVAGESYAPLTGSTVQLRAYPDSHGVSVFFHAVGDRQGDPWWDGDDEQRTEQVQRATRMAEVVAAGERLRAADRHQNAFADIAATVADARSLRWTLDTVAKVVVDATDLAACAIVLFDEQQSPGRIAGCFGLPEDYPQAFAAASQGNRRLPAVQAYQTSRPVLVEDTAAEPALAGLADRQWPRLICLPLVVRGVPVGAIKMHYPAHPGPDEAGLRFLHAVADQVAVAVHTARLSAEAAEAAVAQERQRLARELHDSVTQALFSMTLLSRATRLHVQRVDGDADGQLAANLAELDQLAGSALAEMRALLYELRPQTLAGRNLLDALRTQAEVLQNRHGLLVEVRATNWPRPNSCVEDELFRLTVEALANVVRHAAATRVRVTLARDVDAGVLSIRDNGVGFDPAVSRPGHLGLETMAERAARIGASLRVASASGQGTTVTVTVPVTSLPSGAPP